MAPEVKRTSLAAAMSPLYATAINMVPALQMRFATAMLSCLATARSDYINDQSTDQFEFSRRIQSGRDDDAAVRVHDDLSEDAPFVYQMNNGFSRVWSTPDCRPMQIKAVQTIVFDLACKGKLLVVNHTGGGKGHVLRMIATFVGGITVVIVPLLALTADQMSKIEEALEECGSVAAVHLDELSRSAIRDEVIPRMKEIGYDSESTLFLFTSPQKLANSPDILNALFVSHA